MSADIAKISERQLTLGIIKLAIGLVMFVLLIGLVVSLLADRGQQLVVTGLLITVAFSLLANGVLAVLKILDWVEARRSRADG